MSGAAEPFRSGAAREVPKGRLASFEDEPAPTFALPPRPGQARPAATVAAETAAEEAPPAGTGVDATDETPGHLDETGATTTDPGLPGGAVEVGGPVRASNVHIPAELLDAFNTAKASHKLSNGELIITAIEATYEELQRQLRPPSATGGSLFAPRVSRPPRLPAKGPVTPVNYRLRPDDYATLDRLVRDLGASSRSHLISEALRTYLSRTA